MLHRVGTGPRVGTRIANLWNEIERPRKRTVVDLESHHPTLDTPVAAGLCHIYQAVPHDGRRADALADAPVGDLSFPESVARLRVKRVQEAVLRAANNPPMSDCDALVRRVHLGALRDVMLRPDAL